MQTWSQFQAEQSSRKVLRLDSDSWHFQYKPDADRHLGEAVPPQEGILSTALSELLKSGAVI